MSNKCVSTRFWKLKPIVGSYEKCKNLELVSVLKILADPDLNLSS